MHQPVTAKPALVDLPRRVYRVAELEKLHGISQSKSYRWAKADGPWSRLAPGVVLVARGPATIRDRINAALLRAGPGAMVTGLHAARLHGLKSPPADADIHILIPHSRKIQSYSGTRFERTTRLPQPAMVDGIPVAPPLRAVMDGARTWLTTALTRNLLFEAVLKEKVCPYGDLVLEMNSGSRRGTALPRALLRRHRSELDATRAVAVGEVPPPRSAGIGGLARAFRESVLDRWLFPLPVLRT